MNSADFSSAGTHRHDSYARPAARTAASTCSCPAWCRTATTWSDSDGFIDRNVLADRTAFPSIHSGYSRPSSAPTVAIASRIARRAGSLEKS